MDVLTCVHVIGCPVRQYIHMHKSNLIRGMLGFKNGTPVDKKWEDGLIDIRAETDQNVLAHASRSTVDALAYSIHSSFYTPRDQGKKEHMNKTSCTDIYGKGEETHQ